MTTAPPRKAQKLYDAGLKAQNAGRLALAIKNYQACLKLVPRSAPALNNLGFCLMRQGRHELALKYLVKAQSLMPQDPTILGNLAASHRQLGDFEAARDCLKKRSLVDGSLDTLRLLIGAYRATNELEEALEASERVSSAPESTLADLSSTLHLARELCDWERLAGLPESLISEKLDLCGHYAGTPFRYYSHVETDGLLLKIAEQAAANVLEQFPTSPEPVAKRRRRRDTERPRIGFISQDFRDHPMLKLVAGLIESGDDNNVDVFVYSIGPDSNDPRRAALKSSATVFRDLNDLSAQMAAERIASDELDALVDLMGYTRNARPEILALRPCLTQVSWLGMPGTSGAPWIDFIIADDIVIPKERECDYSETIIRLTPTYYPFDDRSNIDGKTADRGDHHLPHDVFVFASFNQTFKFCPKRFSTWCEVMSASTKSVLWLLEPSQARTKENIRREARVRGVHPDRVIFAPRVSHEEHLARLPCANLMLDTWLYGGHTTTIDALSQGVPVLTRSGPTFTSRVAASILNAANLNELITYSEKAYAAEAVQLANDNDKYDALAKRCRDLKHDEPPFSTSKFARSFFEEIIAASEIAKDDG